MLFKIISYFPAILGLSTIGLITFLKNSKSRVNIIFFCLTATIALWLLILFIGDLTISANFSLWALRVAAAVGTLIVPLVLYFSIYFPVPLKRQPTYFHFLAIGPAIFFGVLSITSLLIPSVEIQTSSAQPTNLGGLYTAQSIYAIVGFIAAFIIVLRKFTRVGAREREQIRLVILGLMIALGVNIITGFLLAETHQANNYSNLAGNLSLLIFAAMTSFAIVRHGLFDIKLAIVRTVGFLITVGIAAAIYSLLIIGVGAPLITEGRITLVKNNLQLLLLLPPTIFIALTFHSLQQFIARSTRRIFYQETYDLRTTLDALSDTLITDNDIDKIMHRSLTVIGGAIKPSHAYFIVLDESGKLYREVASNRHRLNNPNLFFEEITHVRKRILVRDEAQANQWPKYLEQEGVSLVLKLGSTNNPVGALFFGPKQNGRIYTQQDIDLLTIGAKNLAVAIENTKKYDQISKFAETLREEVLKATASLRKANQKLKTLDALKDDFISMISHQLRTPVSSVHEAIQMLNQESLTPSERKHLGELAEASSEHLVSVVVDMLSVARIQAGRFDMDKTPNNLEALVERALKEMDVLAAQKNIKLIFNKPPEAKDILVDRAKINEAISNYIENAIKYSEENSQIIISLKYEEERAVFEVIDSGIGIPEVERKNLFVKFYRARNAKMEHPDGNGIGLFVVKNIVEAHGGQVYYKPKPRAVCLVSRFRLRNKYLLYKIMLYCIYEER